MSKKKCESLATQGIYVENNEKCSFDGVFPARLNVRICEEPILQQNSQSIKELDNIFQYVGPEIHMLTYKWGTHYLNDEVKYGINVIGEII
jgi:hypothetical protein